MSVSSATADEVPDLTRPAGPMRLFEATALPYPVVSALLMGGWLAASATINAIGGQLGQAEAGNWLFRLALAELLQGALLVYLLTCEHVGQASTARDLEQLRGAVEASESEFADLAGAAWRQRPAIGWITVIVPLLGGLAMVELDPALWVGREKPSMLSTIYAWSVLRNSLMGWAIARLFVAEIRWTRAFVSMADRLRVPLPTGADPEVFLRKGLRSAAIWLVFSSLFSLFWLDNSAGSLNWLLFMVMLATATCALFIPLRAFRSTVHEAKRIELEHIDGEIARERGPLLDGTSSDSSRLGSLAAWRSLVEGVDEWPLSAPAAIRFGLFVLLGLGSWLGGALVERGLDVFFE
jgi:hypothetical protein